MANTQKKKSTSQKSAPKRTTAKNTKSAKSSNVRKQSASPKPRYTARDRWTGCAVCTILALLVCATYFNAEAIVLSFVAKLLKGLFGYGYWVFGPALIICAIFYVTHEEPVKKRVVPTMLFPLVIGGLCHIFLCRNEYELKMSMVKALWADGIALASGGVIPGSITVGLIALISKVVTCIVFLVLLITLFILAFHISPAQVIADVREEARIRREERELAAEEEEELPEEFIRRTPAKDTQDKSRRKSRFAIDIPLDDDEPKEVMQTSNKSLFRKNEGRTPAQIAEEQTAAKRQERDEEESAAAIPVAPVVPAAPVKRASAPVQMPTPVSAAAPVPEMPSIQIQEEKKRAAAMEREELSNATEEVSREIEQGMEEQGESYSYPPVTLLEENRGSNAMEADAEQRSNAHRLADTLTSFGVVASPDEVVHGPSVTRYEFRLDQGVKLSKITNLSDDIALALGAASVRVAPVPGKISQVGIEVPNRVVTMVKIRDVIESSEFVNHSSNVAFAVGKDIAGNNIVGNIAKLPHVLIAGTTGSGKSVCTNSLIISMLYKSSPEDVRFIMVDPKMVELAPYNGIPHLLIPVVTDPKKAAGALQWAVFEMMKRYKIFSENGVKDLKGFNTLAEQGTNPELKKMASVVVVIDELADLMMIAAKEVEESICRVAQMGRAAGMHLVIATQRPSSDVITGLMKANIPSRIAFAVASSLESRIILDITGAEKLVGHGDMLYFPLGESKPTRVQGCFISPEEIERVVDYVKSSSETHYDQSVMDQIAAVVEKGEKNSKPAASGDSGGSDAKDDTDELFPQAVDVILETGQASVSMLQRRLKLGYSRAARLVDQMEERGIVGPFEGSKPRQLLISKEKWQEMQMKNSLNANEQPQPTHDPYGTISDVMESHDALD